MLPKSLALIDDDKEYAASLALALQEQGIRVDVFCDSNDLLVHADPYSYGFYIVDLVLPGIGGVDLIKLLRRRTSAGLLVVTSRTGPEAFKDVILAGADMYLAKPVPHEQVSLAVKAVHRRVGSVSQVQGEWRLERRTGQLVAPDGARVDLSDIDQALMECFVEAQGEVVGREVLRQRIGKPEDTDTADGLNATIYRLRRRIERATPLLVPLQSKSRVGYVFRAPLTAG